MPNITSKIGRYCAIHRYIHENEYLECDFCNEHKWGVYYRERYYNYGFSKCSYHACIECDDMLFGPFRSVNILIPQRAYEDILEIINERTFDRTSNTATTTIAFYEAARLAYTDTDREYMRKFIECEINVEQINKELKLLWEFTYKILSGEDSKRVRVVNKDPDNLQVQWVPGGKTVTEILEELRVKPTRS